MKLSGWIINGLFVALVASVVTFIVRRVPVYLNQAPGMEQNGPRTTRVDRLWLRACGVIFLMTFGTVAVLMTIEEHRFARGHRLEVDYNAFAGQIVFGGGMISSCMVLYVFAIPSRLLLNLCLPSRWYAYRWETLWLLVAFGTLSWAVYIMATTKAEG